MNPVECCAWYEPVKAASQQVPSYRLWVCDECWQNAENGWAKDAEPVLFAALASAGLLIPDRNEQGFLPRAYAPPSDYALGLNSQRTVAILPTLLLVPSN